MKRATTVKETLEHCKWKYTESKKDSILFTICGIPWE
jgi:hypothetical protein